MQESNAVRKIRKPYTITKLRDRWTEHYKFLEALGTIMAKKLGLRERGMGFATLVRVPMLQLRLDELSEVEINPRQLKQQLGQDRMEVDECIAWRPPDVRGTELIAAHDMIGDDHVYGSHGATIRSPTIAPAGGSEPSTLSTRASSSATLSTPSVKKCNSNLKND
ncbi:hypothetical protein SELMODRAFT_425450 [Selaginella moellendorffii]|uniref:Uncharacterized protein n=1 Tax=Selaginella moellendorffii TaxID=88036 RepID=D8ST51_SELML|nr:hypothetical protein SELMODRAFT_425450 [Selaginella moellendorffii]